MWKRTFAWILILGTALGGLYAFESTRVPCRTALAYTIGQFDGRFGLSLGEFQAAIIEAEKPWEEALGRDLFQYDEQALFPVNLIFDERQARTIESQALEKEFANVQSKQETIKQTYDKLSAELDRVKAEHAKLLAVFERNLSEYNNRVAAWNASSRTDETELEWLRDSEARLKRDQDALESKRLRANVLVTEVNRYAKEEEKVITRYNSKLDTFTETYGTGEAFDQGVYRGESIDIYQFDDRSHLRMVLVHELGHALGLEHVENPKSIMYPMMGGQDLGQLSLSIEDRAELMNVCSVTAWDLLFRDLHKVVALFAR
ncbi:MAG: matrixin family metalloprotease [Undibacterium sp.]